MVAIRHRQDEAGMAEGLKKQYDDARSVSMRASPTRVDKLHRGDELPPGVMKVVKVFVAVKRKLQPGDKMAGRHGWQRASSPRSFPIEDMPFLEDGTHVDIVAESAGRARRDERRSDFETHFGLGLRGRENRSTRSSPSPTATRSRCEAKLRKSTATEASRRKARDGVLIANWRRTSRRACRSRRPCSTCARADIRPMLKDAGFAETGQVDP